MNGKAHAHVDENISWIFKEQIEIGTHLDLLEILAGWTVTLLLVDNKLVIKYEFARSSQYMLLNKNKFNRSSLKCMVWYWVEPSFQEYELGIQLIGSGYYSSSQT